MLIGSINPDLPKLGKELLRKLKKEEITLTEFDHECAYWMTTNLSEYHYHHYPNVPQDLIDYKDRKLKDFRFSVSQDFWKQAHIFDYLRQSNDALHANACHIYWLEFMKKNIPQEDITTQKKIKEVLDNYPISVRNT